MISKFGKVLFATDLSEHARKSFDYLIEIIKGSNVQIVLLHVMEDTPKERMIMSFVGEDLWSEIKRRNELDARDILIGKKEDIDILQKALNRFCEDVKDCLPEPKVEIEVSVVRSDNASEEVVRQAEKRGCDIIVMGHHSRGALAHFFLGSTAQGILRLSKKPILLIPHQK